MGEWKSQVTVRVRQTLWAEIAEFAAKERRTMSNVSEVLSERSTGPTKESWHDCQLLRTLPDAEQSLDGSVLARRTEKAHAAIRDVILGSEALSYRRNR
jgi:hypothetical protein